MANTFFSFLGCFILFDHLVRTEKNKLFNYLIAPIILVFLASKPTTFFWIPLYYPLKRKYISIYFLAAVFQLILIYIFAFQTKTNINDFYTDYSNILLHHRDLTGNVESVFSINFSTLLQSFSSILVIFNLILFLLFCYWKFIKKILVDRSTWLFTCVTLSFIVIYHRNYETFLLLLPLFIMNENSFQRKNVFLMGLLVYIIVIEKLVLMYAGADDLALAINNFFILVITALIQLNSIKQIYSRQITN